jgi:hypothetical protein
VTRLVRRRLFFDGSGDIDASILPDTALAYDLAFDFGPTVLDTTAYSVVVARAISIPNNFGGSSSKAPGTNPTATATFTIAVNGATIGTLAVSTAGALTWAFSSPGADLAVAANSRVTITPPSPADATLANFQATIAATRT